MSDIVRMTIALPKDAYARLREDGRRELRQPRQQAHWLLYKALGITPGKEKANRGAQVVEAERAAVAE